MNSPGGVGQEEIDAPGIRDEVALGAAAARVAPFGVLDDPFEIVEVTENRLLEVGVGPDAGRYLVEQRAGFGGIDAADQDVALTGPNSAPDRRGGRRIEGARDRCDVEANGTSRRRGFASSRLRFVFVRRPSQ